MSTLKTNTITPVSGTTVATTGDATVSGTLGVTGDATVSGTLGVTGDATVSGSLSVTGDITSNGVIAQIVETTSSAYQSSSATIPFDDTIPQNTEGVELLTVSITPKSALSTLIIDIGLHLSDSSAATNGIAVALFQDSTADALAVTAETAPGSGRARGELSHKMTSGTTSAITFKVRAGSGSGASFGLNGRTAREFGGTANSYIRVTEILQ